jgi:precorrin-2 dehydrogenase/sirohydrochlorin ferrochelatase/precorrin-6A/cobalt-precorrin-6A reductase
MKILVFGGTTEGREFSALLTRAGIDVTLSVATDFGRDAANGEKNVYTNKLGKKDMVSLLKKGGFDCAVDATHPYAVLATENIRLACEEMNVEYYRLKRPESTPASGVIYVSDAAGAAEILKGNEKTALLTVGSKDLESFTRVQNYAERLFVRILPMRESLKKAFDLGFHGSNIICMQGPFNREMNIATLKMTGAEYLITKDSGDIGGFKEKVSAAAALGCEVIVIGRPVREEGYTLEELVKLFNVKDAGSAEKGPQERSTFFPLFIDMNEKKVLVTGGGNVAERRIRILSDFGAKITLISPEVTEYIESLAIEGKIEWLNRKYQKGDIIAIKPLLVLAATGDRQTNREVMEEAVSLGIQISVADRREECTFWFPAIAESEKFICGIVSKDGDHAGVKLMAETIRKKLQK